MNGFLLTLRNFVLSPGQMRVIVVVTAEGAVVRIQTFGANCEGILASKVFLICNEHLVEILAVFLTYISCTARWWVHKWLEWCRNVAKLSICFLTNAKLVW